MSDVEFIQHPITGSEILARMSLLGASEAATVAEQVSAAVRPIGLAIVLSRSPSAFIQSAKLTKSPSVRAFNALHFS